MLSNMENQKICLEVDGSFRRRFQEIFADVILWGRGRGHSIHFGCRGAAEGTFGTLTPLRTKTP